MLHLSPRGHRILSKRVLIEQSAIEVPHFIHFAPAPAAHETMGDKRWRALGVICCAMFISAIDMTIVNVALPDMSHELDAGIGELQWVLDAFLVSLAGLLLLGSGLADRFGVVARLRAGARRLRRHLRAGRRIAERRRGDRLAGADGRGGGVRAASLAVVARGAVPT